jgi:hypothetical protein
MLRTGEKGRKARIYAGFPGAGRRQKRMKNRKEKIVDKICKKN